MTLKTRRLLFYLSVFFFVIAATAVIFYSIGFRIDFKNKIITETGGIYVKSKPPNAEITLDEESVKNQSGILSAGTFIDNLVPGMHHLVLNLDGYSGWQKDTPVLAGSVSVFDYVVLIPNELRVKLMESVDSFAFANGVFVTETGGVVKLDEAELIGNEIVHFTEEGTVITKDSSTDTYYLSDIFDLSSSLNLNAIFNNLKETRLGLPGAVPIKKIQPYPSDDSRFVVMTGKAIYSVDTNGLEIRLIDSSASDFIISGNQLFWINDSGIKNLNLLFDTSAAVSADEAENIKSMSSNSAGDSVFLLNRDGTLKHINLKTATSTVISTNVDMFSLSPNDKMLSFVEKDGLLKIYYLDWEEGDNGKQVVELITLESEATEISWYTNLSYLFVKDTSNRLKFIEIDRYAPINEVIISEDVNNFVYDGKTKTLYYGNNSGVWKLEI